MLAKHALSQLSYGPEQMRSIYSAARQAICEANGRERQQTNAQHPQMTHSRWFSTTQQEWWAWEDLNLRPHAYQARALTN